MRTLKTLFITLFFGGSLFIQGQNIFPSSGNVGIGLTNPNEKLHIHNNAVGSFIKISGAAPGLLFSQSKAKSSYLPVLGLATANNYFLSGAVNGDLAMRSSDGGRLLFGTLSGTDTAIRMTILNNGNIGIGTTNPAQELHIIKNDGNADVRLQGNGGDYTDFYSAFNHAGIWSHGSKAILFATRGLERMQITKDGNVGIGTNIIGSWKLAVNGKIRAKEIKVETGWADFVFYDDYKLPTLEEVELHIKEKGHLKDIPSAKEVEENGIFLGEMDSKLLQKIEELTLYTIAQEKKIKDLASLNKKLLELQSRLEKLESEK